MPKGAYKRPWGTFKTMKLHPSAHPLVKTLHAEIVAQKCTFNMLATRTGMSYDTVRKWFTGVRNPRLFELEAALNAVGLNIYAARTPKFNRPLRSSKGDE